MATRMQQRRGTALQWTTADTVLAAGEIGYETDTKKFKIGDGLTAWTSLPYFVNVADIIDGAPGALDTLNELAAALNDDANFATTVTNVLAGKSPFLVKTQTQWNAYTDNLSAGTIAVNSSSTNAIKIGVGTLPWADLPYVVFSDSFADAITTLTTAVTDAQSDATIALGLAYGHDTGKANVESPTFTGNVTLPSTTTIGNVSVQEISYLDGVTSKIQDQLDAKLASSTAATTYATKDSPTITGTAVLPSTTTIGSTTGTELSYVHGVTSGIQGQIDAKAPLNAPTFTGTVSGITKSMVGLGNVDNTSDANKPVSTATQTALDLKANLAGPTFTGTVNAANLTLSGNLTVNGTTTTVNASNLVISDPLIYLGEGNSGNTSDLGFVANFNDGTYQHAGLVRDSSDGKWKLFKGVTDEPTNTVNFSQGSLDDLALDQLTANGIIFTDGEQTKQGVPSITPIIAKTASYTLGALTERDSLIEVNSSSATTITIPTDATLNFPVGTSLDILQTNTGQVTIAGAGGVTVNATPGLKLRTQWSSATIFKRAANTWVVYGDLTA